MKRWIVALAGLVVIVGCGGDDAGDFDEDAARDAAIEWNPGNSEGVDELVAGARETCGDDELLAEWIRFGQNFVGSEDLDIMTAGCAERIAHMARDLALPVPD